MKCKKHPIDHSSSMGVCATCLRQRLVAIIAAQSNAEAQEESEQARKKPDNNPPPPLLFPRSVSPYISRRKSDTASATWNHNNIKSYHSLPDPKFFSTPQIGPTGGIIVDQCYNKKKSKFGLFSSFFRSKSDKPRVSESRESSAKSSPAWLPNFLSKKKAFSVEEPAIRHRRRDRGMSPEMNSDDENSEPSLYSSGEWKQTPMRTPAASVGRRGGGASCQLSRNVSGISFCLSPMVRASPCQNWNHKGGAPPEMAVSGELRMPMKSHSISASFYKTIY